MTLASEWTPKKGVENLTEALAHAEEHLAVYLDRNNPYWSAVLEADTVGYIRGMRIALQIITGVRH